MLIRIGYHIALGLPNPSPIVFLLRVHSSRESMLVGAENFRIEPELEVEDYLDAFGNRCGRLNARQALSSFSVAPSFATAVSQTPTLPKQKNTGCMRFLRRVCLLFYRVATAR